MLRPNALLSRRHRGFTLIEMVVAMAIVGIMAGLSIAALSGLKKRGNFVSATGDLLEGLRLTRAEAFSRQAPCIFIIDTVGNNWWSIVDVANTFNLSTFAPATPAPSPAILLASGTLPTGVIFGPSTSPGGYGANYLPAPYGGIPGNASTSPTYPYCTFCLSTGGNAGFGSISFYGAGSAVFSANSSSWIGHQFTIQSPQPGGSGLQTMTFAVVARTGASATFESAQ
jgi:prepilin-type N-terminal cleavage/methylation domain-containing protein